MLAFAAVIDLHCHIAFGMDDGPKDLEMAQQMAEGLAALGYRRVAVTPHLPWGSYLTEVEVVRERLKDRIEALQKRCPGMDFLPGAEHHSDLLPSLLASDRPLCYPGGGCFLLEFPLLGFPARLEDLLFRVEVGGLKAAVAHVERYPEVQQDISAVQVFSRRGFPLLVNLGSLAGEWGKESARAARELIKNGRCDALTTDLHSPAQLEVVAEGLRIAGELVGQDGLARLVRDNPAAILAMEPSR